MKLVQWRLKLPREKERSRKARVKHREVTQLLGTIEQIPTDSELMPQLSLWPNMLMKLKELPITLELLQEPQPLRNSMVSEQP